MIRKFELHEPDSVAGASSLLAQYGDEAKILAGGTELFLVLKEGFASYPHLINIKTIAGLDQLSYDQEQQVLRIGSLVTHRTLEKSPMIKEQFPLMAEVEHQIANVRVRNVGTIGGNLCFAEPHADPGTLLLACGARVKASNGGRERELSIPELFVDYYETALEPDEILTEISVPRLAENVVGAYLRFCPGERPTVGVAALVNFGDGTGIEDVVLALGCVNPRPIRAEEAEVVLCGKAIEEATTRLDQAGELAARVCDPLNDLRGTAEYKRQLVKVLVKRAIQEACRRREASSEKAKG
jgi:aerobic carbon-monoxide dehydrogenase medium subunit